MHKNFLLAGLAAGLIVLIPHGAARAAEPCDLQAQADALADAKTKNDGSVEGLKAELAARKDVLRQTLSCAADKTDTLRASVEALKTDDKDILVVRDRFAGRLDEAKGHYLELEAKIDDLGLRGSKDMARDLLAWRTGTYLPVADEAGNLVIWNKNQPLFAVAQDRLDRIGQTVHSLKLLESDDVKAAYEKSQADLAKAVELNKTAREALVADAPAAETNPKIKASLEALSDTYKSFLDLSDAAKKLLPI